MFKYDPYLFFYLIFELKKKIKMKTFKYILKGVLFYTTFLLVLLFLSAIDSIVETGNLLISLLFIIALIAINIKVISKEDFKVITFNKEFKDIEI